MMTKAKSMVFQLPLLTVVSLLNFTSIAGQSLVIPDLPDMTVPYGSTVEFKFNKTRGTRTLTWSLFGIYQSPFGNPTPRLFDAANFDPKLVAHDPRVSFIGDLATIQPWFKMVNVTENDTNIYQIRSNSGDGQAWSKVNLTVLPGPTTLPPVTSPRPTTTNESTPSLMSTTEGPGSAADEIQLFKGFINLILIISVLIMLL